MRKEKEEKLTVKELTNYFGISRQAYYKSQKVQEYKTLSENLCLKLVQEVRNRQPNIGGKKLYYLLSEDLNNLPYKISRDKLFMLLGKNDMLVKMKHRYKRTTDSNSANPIYPNLIKDLEVSRPNEVLVADITYIRRLNGFAYLSLVCDLHSRKILGFHVSSDLSLTGPLKALKMSIKKIPPRELQNLIHHSDRGCQYRSNYYIDLLKNNGCRISMSRKGNPYDNAVMERINGILKKEFWLDEVYKDLNSIKKAVEQAVTIYNEERPHLSLAYKTPSYVYHIGVEEHAA